MSLTQLNPNTPLEEPACRVRFSEERACRVRRAALDYPSRFRGHDKRAPPNLLLEGPACQVRCAMLDHPSQFIGHDERAPPSGRDRHAPPYVRITVVVPTILTQILKPLPRFP